MDTARRVRRLDIDNLIRGIRDISYQNNLGSSTPLITDLRINQTFKDKAEKKEISITDLVLLALRLLREDIQVVVDFMELVELQDEGQPSYIVGYKYIPSVLMY